MALSTVYLAQRNAAISHGLVGVYGRFFGKRERARRVRRVHCRAGRRERHIEIRPVGDHQFGPWRLGHVTLETS